MKKLNNRGDIAQLNTYCNQMKLQVPGSTYIELCCWSKGFHGKPQTTQTVAKTTGCFPHTAGKALLLKRATTKLVENGDVELVPT